MSREIDDRTARLLDIARLVAEGHGRIRSMSAHPTELRMSFEIHVDVDGRHFAEQAGVDRQISYEIAESCAVYWMERAAALKPRGE